MRGRTIKMLDPVKRSRLHEEIVGQLQRKIIKGDLPPGHKLMTERALAERLNVNRATVREALKKLEFLELVDINHGDGVYVKNYRDSGNLELLKDIVYMDQIININILKNLLDVRKILSPEMAAAAALNHTKEHLMEMQEVIQNQEELSIQERDYRVNRIIAKASGNLLFLFIWNFFHRIVKDYGYLYFNRSENAARSELFHMEIYDAMLAKDPEKARKVVQDVLEYTEQQIYDAYENQVGAAT